MNLILQMLKVYGEVTLFKRSPKDTPSSSMMLVIALIFVILTTLLQLSLVFEFDLSSLSFWSQFIFVGVDLLVFAGFIWAVLRYLGQRADFKQMLTAWLMFVGMIDLGLCLVMVLVLAFKSFAAVRILFLIFTLGFSLWSVIFMLNLFRSFFTPVVWKAALIYLIWMLIHFGLVTAYQWGG